MQQSTAAARGRDHPLALRALALALACHAGDARPADAAPSPVPAAVVVPDGADPPGTARTDGDPSTRTVRTRVPDDFPLPTLLGGPWRLDVEWTLARDGPDRLLVDGRGAVTRLVPRRRLADGAWRWMAPDGALLDGGRGRYRLREADGRTVEFVGSRPVAGIARDGGVERWEYDGARLVVHVAASGAARRLRYDTDGALVGVTGRDGAELRYGRGPARPGDAAGRDGPGAAPGGDGASWFESCPVDERCDAADSPPPVAFARGPSVPGASTLDVRPAHCGSHFDEPAATVRGTAIERGMVGVGPHADRRPTSRSFPVVDFVADDELVVVRSRDLSSPTYADPTRDALFDRLMRDGRQIEASLIEPLDRDGTVAATAEAGDAGVTRVDAVPERAVVLELVVRHGTASPDQIRQIGRARAELLRRHGIELRVIEIP